jgi:hypothetical protein
MGEITKIDEPSGAQPRRQQVYRDTLETWRRNGQRLFRSPETSKQWIYSMSLRPRHFDPLSQPYHGTKDGATIKMRWLSLTCAPSGAHGQTRAVDGLQGEHIGGMNSETPGPSSCVCAAVYSRPRVYKALKGHAAEA